MPAIVKQKASVLQSCNVTNVTKRETAVACWSELGQRPMKTQHIFFQHIGVHDPVVENPVVNS